MTHGHELRGGNPGGRWGAGQRKIKGRKKCNNCNSIINKIYFKETINWEDLKWGEIVYKKQYYE